MWIRGPADGPGPRPLARGSRVVGAVIWGLLALTAPAAAAPRVAVVIASPLGQEGLAEDVVVRALLASQQVEVLDEAQRRKLRGLTDQAALLRGEWVPPGLTGFDVDWLVLGRAHFERVGGQVLGDKLVRFDLVLELRLVEADTALVRRGWSSSGQGLALSASSAQRQAAERAAAKVVPELVATATSSRDAMLELVVEGLPDAATAEGLAARLNFELAPGRAEWTSMERGQARYRLQGAGTSPTTLSRSVESAGVAIHSVSQGVLYARLAPRGPVLTQANAPTHLGVTIDLPPLFLAQAEAYARHGVGAAVVINRGNKVQDGLRIRVEGPGLLAAPLTLSVPSVPAKGRQRVPLPLVLDRTRIFGQRGRQSAILQVRLQSASADLFLESVSVTVHDQRTLDWSQPEGVAAFVTGDDPNLRRLADQVTAELPANDPLAALAALWAGLRAQSLRYRPDATPPSGLDEVARPDEVLAEGSGDCEDLAVLVASAAEAAGIDAILLLTPGHVLLALGTKVPRQGEWWLGPEAHGRLEDQGEWFVPVEATLLDRPFREAWLAGAAELERAGGPSRRIRLSEEWQRHPPLSATSRVVALRPTDAGRARELELLRSSLAQAWDRALSRATTPGARARILFHLGRGEEAEQIWRRELAAGVWSAGIDLSNLALIAGDARAAQLGYQAALEKAGPHPPPELLANAALAALALGDRQRFGRRVVELLDGGHHEVVRALARGAPDPLQKGASAGNGTPLAWLLFWLSP